MENTLDFLLKSNGVSKSKLAQDIDVSRQTIIRVAKGFPPSMETGMKIAKYFNKDVNEIFFAQNVKHVAHKGTKKPA